MTTSGSVTGSTPTSARRDQLGRLVKSVDGLLDARFDGSHLTPGLTRRHWQVLTVLDDGCSDGDGGTAGLLAGYPNEISDLRLRGWLSPDGSGGWTVTVEGRRQYAQLVEALAAARERLTDGIDDDDYATAIRVLETVERNLRG